MKKAIVEFVSEIEFVANINGEKDCLMNQGTNQDAATSTAENPNGLWFNIDVPRGHGLEAGDKIRIIVEKI